MRVSATVVRAALLAALLACSVNHTSGQIISCSDCPAGTYRIASGGQGLASCTQCASGYYSTAVASTTDSCQLCPAGGGTAGTTDAPGSGLLTDCKCPADYELDTVNTECDACPNGEHSNAGGTCSPCQQGYYSDGNDPGSCIICTAGTYQPNSGQQSCIECEAGKFSSTEGSTADTCTNCPSGKYAGSTGSSACTTCDPGKYS